MCDWHKDKYDVPKIFQKYISNDRENLKEVFQKVCSIEGEDDGVTSVDIGFGDKEHYILDIEYRDKAIEIIETLFPATPYPKK